LKLLTVTANGLVLLKKDGINWHADAVFFG